MIRANCFFWVASCLACSVSAQDFFVREMYNARDEKEAADLGVLGWNTLVVRNREQLDLCRSLGMFGVYSGIPHGPEFDPEEVRAKVIEVKDHPSLLGYILTDEPDLRFWSEPPEEVEKLVRVVREADPNHPIAVTCSGFLKTSLIPEYQKAVDVLRLDPYPFLYRRPLRWPLEVIDAARAASGNRVPIWLIQQAWSWDETFPCPKEDRCLSYLGLIHGVQGISHYAYHFGDRRRPQFLPEHEPEFWEGLVKTTAELALLGRLGQPGPEQRVLVTSSLAGVDWALRTREDQNLLIIANPEKVPGHVWVSCGPLYSALADFFTGEPLERDETGVFHFVLPPAGARVLRVVWEDPAHSSEGEGLPVILECPDLGVRRSAFERVFVRNGIGTLRGFQLTLMRAGEKIHESTAVRIPAQQTSEFVIRSEDPIARALREEGEGSTLGLVWSDRGEVIGHTSFQQDWNAHEFAGIRHVIGRGEPGTEEGYPIRSEITFPAVFSVESATAWFYSTAPLADNLTVTRREGSWVAEQSILSRGGIPRPLAEKVAVIWLVKGDMGTKAVRGEYTVPRAPVVRIEGGEEPLLFPAGTPREIVARPVRADVLPASATLTPPGNWTITRETGERGLFAWTVTPPEGFLGRAEGSVSLFGSEGESDERPIMFTVPLTAKRAATISGGFPEDWSGAAAVTRGGGNGLSAELRLLWDEDALYVRVEVADKMHVINSGEGGVWRGDSLQLSLLAGPPFYRIPSMGDQGLSNFGFAFDAEENRPLVDLGFVPDGVDRDAAREAVRMRGERAEGITLYEVALPWKEMGADLVDAKGHIRFSLLVNDYNTEDRSDRAWLEFGSGIVRGLDTWHFLDAVLE